MVARTLKRIPRPEGDLIVEQQGSQRQLHFSNGILQTLIDLNAPGSLPSPANQAMLAHLAFGQEPRRVLLGGSGGGAVGHWFAHQAPDCVGDAVEIDPQVARLARQYFDFPPPDSRWQLHQADIRQFVKQRPGHYDFILLDIEQHGRSPLWLSSPEFLADCRRALTRNGVLTLNLIADDAARFAGALWDIRRAFGQRSACLSLPDYENVIVLAFNSALSSAAMSPSQIQKRQLRWQLPLADYLARMRKENPAGSGIF